MTGAITAGDPEGPIGTKDSDMTVAGGGLGELRVGARARKEAGEERGKDEKEGPGAW